MPMTRFETGSYGVESDHSDNCATRESNYVEKILKELNLIELFSSITKM